MAYLLDSNVFIQASRQHYGMDFCPAFWDWLLQAHENEVVLSVEVPSSSKNRIKIPDACIGVGVKYVRIYDLLRRKGVRFVLGSVG